MKKILVTGGAGFIGSHTCVNLLEKGYKVVLLDSFINSSEKVVQRIIDICKIKDNSIKENLQIFKGDIREITFLESVFNEAKESGLPIAGVIHFAALKSVSESLKNPSLYWDVNVGGAINLVKAMEKYDCRFMVFSSSATIYGEAKNSFVDEESEKKPLNPYGVTKFVVENFLNDIFNSSNNKCSIANLRYFNPVGAHSSGLIGESPVGDPTNIFPIILDVAARKIKRFKVYGNDWPTYDGTGVRDYIHVMDIAESHLEVLEYLFNNEIQIINLNLGTGIGTSVLEFINIFQETNNVQIPYEISEKREGDAPLVVANNKLAFEIIKWKPKRDLIDICKDGWRWRIKNPNGY